MKNQGAEHNLTPTGALHKDKRTLVLFLFGTLMLAGDILWNTQDKPLNRFALLPTGISQDAGLIRLDPQTMVNERVVPLEPQQPIPAEVPARYALFLHQPLPINRADSATLALLPGVGPHLAGAITDEIRRHGPLTRAEALLTVEGIGPKTLERLRPLIRLDQ